MEAAAQTLAYEAFVMGRDNELPAGLLAGIAQPTLVLNGGASPAWMGRAGKAVASAMPVEGLEQPIEQGRGTGKPG